MEALGDAIVPGEAPHGGDLGLPGAERLTELDELSQFGLAQIFERLEKLPDQRNALLASTMLL